MKAQPTLEGAGVHLNRVFGFRELPDLDPFLLLDDFRSENPDHYLPGFPWHPHRGIETITYVFSGRVEHGDSMGHQGVIGPGDVQWMTAGNGVIHQEMPKGDARGRMGGLQLWTNLPSTHKRMPARYRGITASEIPEVVSEDGVKVKVIAGSVDDVIGPVRDVIADPEYLDVTVPLKGVFRHSTPKNHNVLAYVLEGEGLFGGVEGDEVRLGNRTLAVFGEGHRVEVRAGAKEVRFIFLSGLPLKEPVAWKGPIVMNTQDELIQAFDDLEQGTFLDLPPNS
jgi:hypothetical protein